MMVHSCYEVVKDFTPPVIAVCVGWVALSTYRGNLRTRRAEFLTDLHAQFFVDKTYKEIRAALDDEKPVNVEGEDFTDFLNFFEFVAYLENEKNITLADVKALFGYYLSLLNRQEVVVAYVAKRENSFEHLHQLLGKIKTTGTEE